MDRFSSLSNIGRLTSVLQVVSSKGTKNYANCSRETVRSEFNDLTFFRLGKVKDRPKR